MTIQIPSRVVAVQSPEQKVYNEKPFPLILSPAKEGEFKDEADFIAWTMANVSQLKDLLVEYGVIAFRGFNLPTANEFNNFAESFGFILFPDFRP